MAKRYGKIKNGKLILASIVISRDGVISIDDNKLYESNGYKKIIYSLPPENKEGYDLVSSWEEDSDAIIQKWGYVKIGDDYSGELLVAVRQFSDAIVELKRDIKDNYDANDHLKEQVLNKQYLIKLIYERKNPTITTAQMLKYLSEVHLDLEKFFEKIGLKAILDDMNVVFVDGCMFLSSRNTTNKNLVEILNSEPSGFSDERIDDIKRSLITPMYIKSNLSYIYSLENHTTTSNTTMYNMAFIYLFTVFDELLLKVIRLICMHEKRWLISNANLTATDILKCNTTDELHKILVDNKVNELAWKSYADKLEFLKGKGVSIDTTHKKLFDETITYFALKRNVMVHNEGVWSQATKDMLKNTAYYQNINVGEQVVRTYDSFLEACDSLETAVAYLYDLLCDKFKFLFRYEFLPTVDCSKNE